VAPLDPRVRALPLPDSLMGRLLEYAVAHEVGHTLGLRHNMEASAEYPADSVRSRSWLQRMGYTPSIMDYARFNYVVQPEDSIPSEELVPRIGPYDAFAIHWGYAPISLGTKGRPGSGGAAADPWSGRRATDAEVPTLDRWAMEQDTVAWYRYTDEQKWFDPGVESEAVGDADAVRSTTQGLKNIERTAQLLMPLALAPGSTNDNLRELYDRLVDQWTTEIGHVVAIVGGVRTREKSGSQPGRRFTPVSAARQRSAVAFVVNNALRTPRYLIDSLLLARLEPDGALERVRKAQAKVLSGLLDQGKIGRLEEQRSIQGAGSDAYDPVELYATVRHAVWSELTAPTVVIDGFRRNLQREYLALLDGTLNPNSEKGIDRSGAPHPGETDTRSLARAELTALSAEVNAARGRAGDPATRSHLAESLVEMDRSLSGGASAVNAAASRSDKPSRD
jgi:hypothetical protein